MATISRSVTSEFMCNVSSSVGLLAASGQVPLTDRFLITLRRWLRATKRRARQVTSLTAVRCCSSHLQVAGGCQECRDFLSAGLGVQSTDLSEFPVGEVHVGVGHPDFHTSYLIIFVLFSLLSTAIGFRPLVRLLT